MIISNRKIVLFALALLFVCVMLISVDASYKAKKKFIKHLYKFVKKEKKFLHKKGFDIAAFVALSQLHKKKIPIPLLLPLPLPFFHQEHIIEVLPPPIAGKFANKGLMKGMALDMVTMGKGGGMMGGMGGMGGMGMMGGMGGLGGIGLGGLGGGLGGLGLGGII